MNNLTYLLFEFGYTLIFGMLGLITLFLSIPKEKEFDSYRKARIALGTSLCAIAVYCINRILLEDVITPYIEFWLLVTFTLIHSWATYASLLFLMETPRYLRKHFFIDGIVPTAFLLISGVIGLIYPETQEELTIAFGCIYGVKCIRMFYICHKEYNKCQEDLNNYYDQSPDIKWIRNLMFLSLFMSAITVISFYIPATHPYYYLSIPVIYGYIVYKVLEFVPKKIDTIRAKTLNITQKEEEKANREKAKELSGKIGPMVEKWVEEKLFCKPELNIKEVAMQMGTNQNYLSSYLNKHLNTNFQVWLNTLRIEESKNLLTSGEKISIEEVGIRVGIPQSYNFSRWFKAITEMTPYQYRKLNYKVTK